MRSVLRLFMIKESPLVCVIALYLYWFSSETVGRHRWVEYAEKGRYNASQVPPEWHGWLHNVTDHTGDEASVSIPDSSLWVWTVNCKVQDLDKEQPVSCSFWCWNLRGMVLSTERISQERVMSSSITPRDMHSTLARETGRGISHGSLLRQQIPSRNRNGGFSEHKCVLYANNCYAPWSS